MISVYYLFEALNEDPIEPAFGAGIKKNIGGPGYLSTTQTAQGVPPPSIAKSKLAAQKKYEESQRMASLLAVRAKKAPGALPQTTVPTA